jgi:tetratricopeptide (TPR) repeat protein/CHAT domain-containing protein
VADDALDQLIEAGFDLFAQKEYLDASLPLRLLTDHLRTFTDVSPEILGLRRVALSNLGTCYIELNRLDDARRCLEESIDLATILDTPQAAATALHELSLVCWKEGALVQAIEYCERSLALIQRRGDDPSLPQHTLAILFQETGRYSEAHDLLMAVADRCRAGHDLAALSRALNELGLVNRSLGRVEEAVAQFVESIKIKDTLGNYEGIATTMANIDATLAMHPDEARRLPIRQRLSELQQLPGPDGHPQAGREVSQLNHAVMRAIRENRLQDALRLGTRAVHLAKARLGPTHYSYAAALENLGTIYREMGDIYSAETLYEQALSIMATCVGTEHPDYITALNNLANVWLMIGASARAEGALRLVVATREQVLGPAHPDYAQALDSLAQACVGTFKFNEAETLYTRALQLRAQYLGTSHVDYAISLTNLAGLHQQNRLFLRADPLLRRALEIKRVAVGERHASFAIGLGLLAHNLEAMGDLSAAMREYEKSLEVFRISIGEAHPHYAHALTSLGSILTSLNRQQEAEELFRRALTIQAATVGPDHRDYIVTEERLTALLIASGRVEEALASSAVALLKRRDRIGESHPHYLQSLVAHAAHHREAGSFTKARVLLGDAERIARQSLGAQHQHYSTVLNNLATICADVGTIDVAEQLCRRADTIVRESLGADNPQRATSLNNLAVIYKKSGRLDDANRCYEEAAAILRAAGGERQPLYLEVLDNHATALRQMGDFVRADALTAQLLDVQREMYGDAHPNVASVLTGLAAQYLASADYARAQDALEKAKAIYEVTTGRSHTSYFSCINNLAVVRALQGDTDVATELLESVASLQAAALGSSHPKLLATRGNAAGVLLKSGEYQRAEMIYRDILAQSRGVGNGVVDLGITTLNNLGYALLVQNRPVDALTFLEQARRERATTGRAAHPDDILLIQNLAVAYTLLERFDEAIACFEESGNAEESLISQLLFVTSEGQRRLFCERARANTFGHLSLVLLRFMDQPGAVRAAMTRVLRVKAIEIDTLAAQRDVVLQRRHPTVQGTLLELRANRERAASMILEGPAVDEDPSAHGAQVAACREQRHHLEQTLARTVREYTPPLQFLQADASVVAKAMPEGSVLLEFVRCSIYGFNRVGGSSGDHPWEEPRYVVFVLPAGPVSVPQLIDLGDAARIDELVHNTRLEIAASSDESDMEAAGVRLSSVIWRPVSELVPQNSHVFVAPDGELNRISFEALPLKGGHGTTRVFDHCEISYVTSGRDLLKSSERLGLSPGEPLVVADPAFNWNVSGEESAPSSSERRRRLAHELGRFGPLKGTAAEGEHVARCLGVAPRLRQDAHKSAVKNSRSPRVLHIATHGFFLERAVTTTEHRRHEVAVRAGAAQGVMSVASMPPSGVLLSDPLLCSGLALAGVNSWLSGGAPPPEAENGLLTGEDVIGMDLTDTDLVVLSACETGLGQIRAGEGVFGLRRAFVLAGTRTLIMSLWKVPDAETRVLMEEFYRRAMGGQPVGAALRSAQLELRKRSAAPFYWAAFVCLGSADVVVRSFSASSDGDCQSPETSRNE